MEVDRILRRDPELMGLQRSDRWSVERAVAQEDLVGLHRRADHSRPEALDQMVVTPEVQHDPLDPVLEDTRSSS